MKIINGWALFLIFIFLFVLLPGARAQASWLPIPQFFSAIGQPLAGGQVFTYQAGTTTPLATYTDSTGTVPNSNPLILDSTGKPSSGIWVTPVAYKFVVEDSNGNIQFIVDNAIFGAATAMTAFSALTPSTNTHVGNFIASGNTWNFNAAILFSPSSAGFAPTTSSSFGYDSSSNKYVFGQNGSTVSFGLASSGPCGGSTWVHTPATAIATATCTQPAASDLSNGTTGSGTVVLAASPTITGTVSGGATYSGPVITEPTVNQGIVNSGSGLQHMVFTSCSMPMGSGCSANQSWNGGGFADTNYTVVCMPVGSGANGDTVVVNSKVAGSINYEIGTLSGLSHTDEIDCIGIHI